MYLKGNHDILSNEIELSKKGGYIFGAKVVRGAYIFTETQVRYSSYYYNEQG